MDVEVFEKNVEEAIAEVGSLWAENRVMGSDTV